MQEKFYLQNICFGDTNFWFSKVFVWHLFWKKIKLTRNFAISMTETNQIKISQLNCDGFFLQISHCGICLTDHDYFVIFINFHTLGHELLSCVVPPLTKRPALKGGRGSKGRFCPPPPPQVQYLILMVGNQNWYFLTCFCMILHRNYLT